MSNKIQGLSAAKIKFLFQNSDIGVTIDRIEKTFSKLKPSEKRQALVSIGFFGQVSNIESLQSTNLISFLTYSQDDILAASALDACMARYIGDDNALDLLGGYADLVNKEVGGTKLPEPYAKAMVQIYDNPNNDTIRRHFYNNVMAKSPNIFGLISAEISDITIKWILLRLKTALKYTGTEGADGLIQFLEKEEIKIASENRREIEETPSPGSASIPITGIHEPSVTAIGDLIGKIFAGGEGQTRITKILRTAFDGQVYTSKERKLRETSFWKVFNALDKNELTEKLQKDQFDTIIQKIEKSGLLVLASYAYDITDFAKKRFKALSQNQTGLNGFIKDGTETAWLDQLAQTTAYLTRDPILLSTINVFFPSLVSYYFEALSVAVDYEALGRGKTTATTEDSQEAFISSLEQAFGMFGSGTDANGKPKKVFEHASRFMNTQKRMQEVLRNSPYREDRPPTSPDAFHLRLGAANFYVPPLSIDINTSFKTGSVTGGALRQKNTPKFNSGYKETSIRMRLFFPNYEEVWGISIDDASQIVLTDNFEIDFKKRRIK